jgi:hypothetical protein
MRVVTSAIELDEILETTDGVSLRFRIEMLFDLEAQSFQARLYRWESVRVSPTFPTEGPHSPSDEEVLVIDEFWDWRSNRFGSELDALEGVLSSLRRQLPAAGIPTAPTDIRRLRPKA